MHLWIVNHYAKPPGDPGAVRHFSLAKHLARTGTRVTIVASSYDHVTGCDTRLDGSAWSGRETHDGVDFVWVKTPPYSGNSLSRIVNMLLFAWRILLLRRWGSIASPDVVLASSPHLFSALTAFAVARLAGARFVLEVRDLWPLSFTEVLGVSDRHPLILLLALSERLLYAQSDHIVTLLPNAVEHIVDHGGSRDRTTWLPNGIDLELVPQVAPAKSGDRFEIVYAGAHGVINALDCVIDAAALLVDRDDTINYQFLLIGDGPEKARLKEKAQTLNLTNVRFLDPVPKEDVYDYLGKADVFVVSLLNRPLYQHGISLNKLYDYLAMGRPTVFGCSASNNPIAEADAGLTVEAENGSEVAEAIAQLAALSPEERNAYGQRGRAHVEANYDYKALAARLASVIHLDT